MFRIQENNEIGQLIGQVQISDLDVETNVNFRLDVNDSEMSEDIQAVRINSTTGELFASLIFDREKKVQYTVLVVAYDPTKPYLSSSAKVYINIMYAISTTH